ncbi:acid phosphatase type 7-like [Watersipora subatra]|uniref:acid phosphatase type 7-like n=1 Tax=Watersipora subatra TaxID=2589382 RepID=UPI00355C71D5
MEGKVFILMALIVMPSCFLEDGQALQSFPDGTQDVFVDLIPTSPHLPEQVHLSIGEDAYSMAVMWATYEEYDEGPSYVHYGLGAGNFTQRAEAIAEDLKNANPRGCKGVFRALMTGLTPHQVHAYRVETNGHLSKNFTFLHPSDEPNRSNKFLIYGDLGKIGGGITVSRLKAEAARNLYDAVLHVGDFAYDLHNEGGRRGDKFLRRIEQIASRLPYMHCVGNHEIPYGFIHYRYRFSSPRVPWPIPRNQMWYSFDAGLAHFISYSTEVYFTDGQVYVARQYEWLQQDLAEANRNRAVRPWIIAFGHRPMYCSNINRDDCTKNVSAMRKEPYNLERLFHTSGVDLIIQAHEHSYERLHPLYNGTQVGCGYNNPSAAVHLIAGSAGCNEREMMCADVLLAPAHHWSAKRSWLPGLNGYGRLHIVNSTHLRWQQIMSISSQPLDEFTLVQHYHGLRTPSSFEEVRC